MWAKMFSRKSAARPAGEIRVAAQLEIREPPRVEEKKPDENPPVQSEPKAESSPGSKLEVKAEEASPSSEPTSSNPQERPTVSSKRPRSSSGAAEYGISSPLRKRPRNSVRQGSPKAQRSFSLPRSPLVRARRISDGPVANHGPKAHPLKEESFTEKESPPPLTSVTLATLSLASPAPQPKRRSRLSLPAPELERSIVREGSVTSNITEQDSQDFNELLRDGFSVHEAVLFQHIRKRGLEPLMPAHWQVDFATMPDNLFAGPDDPAYIETVTLDGTFNATAAFQAVVNLGALVRGKLETEQDAESKILLSMRKYIQWSIDDAKQGEKHIQPLIAISSSQEKGAEHCEHRMDKKLRELAVEFRVEESRLLQENCPRHPATSSTVYGLAVAGCVVALITLDARVEDAPTRTLLVVDFSDVTLDFWNAVGVSLLVIAARDDELERIDFYNDSGLKKPVKAEGMHAWQAKAKVKRLEADSDEDA